jgi:hypothetical protein
MAYNSLVRTAFLLLLAALPDQRAERYFERMKIEPPELSDDVGRRVVVYLLQKEHWVGAFTEIADRFGRFPDELELQVDFRLDGDGEVAQTASRGSERKISFNLKKLCELQRNLDRYAQMKREGKAVVFKVPPLRMERLIYHEVTHVLQGGCDAPKWFTEGMAQMVADDMSAVLQFIHDRKPLRAVDGEITDLIEIYARGHLFWKWLETRGATTRTYDLAFVKRLPWKQALEEATNRSWVNIVSDEHEWSAREIGKLK